MSHCNRCEHRRDTQCSLCRCLIAKKAWLPHDDCPMGNGQAEQIQNPKLEMTNPKQISNSKTDKSKTQNQNVKPKY